MKTILKYKNETQDKQAIEENLSDILTNLMGINSRLEESQAKTDLQLAEKIIFKVFIDNYEK